MNKSHLLHSIRWTLITSVLRRVLTLALFFFIAAWLSKEDLGTFREYNLLIAFAAGIASLSVENLYIINRRHPLTNLAFLWQVTILAAIGLTILFALASSGLGSLYKSRELAGLLLFTSAFAGVEMLRKSVRAMAQNKHQFIALAWAETANVIFYSVLSVIGLYFYRKLWLFVVIFYLGNVLETWILARLNLPDLRLSLRQALRKRRICLAGLYWKWHGKFLAQATLVTLFNQLAGNAPILILGMLVQPVWMGVFFFASQLLGVPVGMFTSALNQVLYPVFAKERDEAIRTASIRYMRLAGLVGMPLLVIYTYLLGIGVRLVFGGKWDDAIPLLPVMLVLYGSFLYSTPLGGIPFIKQKPNWELNWNIISVLSRVLAMLLGMRFSFPVAVLAFSIVAALTNVSFFLMCLHLLRLRICNTLGHLLLSLLPVAVYLLAFILLPAKIWTQLHYLPVCLSGFFIVYLVVLPFIGKQLKSDVLVLLKPDSARLS